jgi:hypothetical protein
MNPGDVRTMRAIGHEQVPYVAYNWPLEAHVRDFSRVLPVFSPAGQAIARWAEVPVGLRVTVGTGALIFLGSPLGPDLRASDPEAHRLFHEIVSQ